MPPKSDTSKDMRPTSSLSSLIYSSSTSSSSSVSTSSSRSHDAEDSDVEDSHSSRVSNGTQESENSSDLLNRLLSQLSSSKGIDVRSPEPFRGDDPSRLRPFLAQCRMMFKANPRKFTNERAKVLFAASYLESVAHAWFEPFLFDDNENDHPFLSSFTLFEEELNSLFGDPNAELTAERKLNKLHMKEIHQVAKYITLFRQYQNQINWDEKALMFRFRQGLAERILDELSKKEERPTTLLSLQQACLKIDQRYWERQKEKIGPLSFKEKNVSYSEKKSNSDQKRSFHTFSKPHMQSTTSSSSFSSSVNNFKPKQLSHIGADRKLTAAERERRKKNGLCMYCGEPGHMADKCPKRKTSTFENKSKSSSSLKAVELSANDSDSENMYSVLSSHSDTPVSLIKATFTIIDDEKAGKGSAI